MTETNVDENHEPTCFSNLPPLAMAQHQFRCIRFHMICKSSMIRTYPYNIMTLWIINQKNHILYCHMINKLYGRPKDGAKALANQAISLAEQSAAAAHPGAAEALLSCGWFGY